MKEMTIEEKAQRYDEVIEIARKEYKKHESFKGFCEMLVHIFPELKESEDERIRKGLLHHLRELQEWKVGNMSPIKLSETYNVWIAWLEKQDEITTNNGESNLLTVERAKENSPFMSSGLENESEDKVESKFKVGDWVVTSYGKVNQVIAVGEYGDGFTDGFTLDDGTYFSGSWKDDYHLWTIADAKDGDVLVRNECIFIFKKITDNDWISTYYVLYCDGELFEHEDRLFTKDRGADGRTHPATKEQRDTLMKAMADAGYAFENKEKYCQKPIEWSLPYEKNKTAEKLIALAECLEADGDCLFNGLSGNDYGKFLRVLAKELTKVEPAEWSEEDKQYFNFLKKLLENLQVKSTENEIKKGTTNNSEYYYKVIQWLNSIKDRIQPKQEWKQENTDDLTDFENAMMHIGGSFFGQHAGLDPNDTNAIKEQANLLLELVPKQKWSEEDEDIFNYLKGLTYSRKDTELAQKAIDWLKSIRLQKRWKPSEEQMKALHGLNLTGNISYAGQGQILIDLYNSLKELI